MVLLDVEPEVLPLLEFLKHNVEIVVWGHFGIHQAQNMQKNLILVFDFEDSSVALVNQDLNGRNFGDETLEVVGGGLILQN